MYYHGSFPKIPNDPNHCGNFIFEKQKEDYYVSLESILKGNNCSMQLILNVKNVRAFIDFEVSMDQGNIYDVVKLDNENTRWFYGKKTLNNTCAINLYLNDK